ncbi:Hmgcr [Trypoxylus dichotomus]
MKIQQNQTERNRESNNTSKNKMASNIFGMHGEFCATHPWEVIVATLTLTACMLTVDRQSQAPHQTPVRYCQGCPNEAEYNATDVIIMTLIRCLALLYGYYQLCHLRKLGSKYILGIAGLFTVISSFVFVSTLINFLRIDVSDLKDAAFFYLFVMDLPKAAMLAEFALSASNQEEVEINIAKGMSVLGPTITLDTIVGTLFMGVGTLSGFQRLEMLSYFACLSAIVNYIVFMTCYPACLSLILELSNISNNYGSLISKALKEEDYKSNPIVQRVKMIMTAGLALVHMHSRLPSREDILEDYSNSRFPDRHPILINTDDTTFPGYIIKWVAPIADQIVLLIVILAVTIKIILENSSRFAVELKQGQSQPRGFNSSVTANTKLPTTMPHPFLKSRSFYLSDDAQKDTTEKSVQTDLASGGIESEEGSSSEPKDVRSFEDCLKIYNMDLDGSALNDDEILLLVKHHTISPYKLEKAVNNPERGVHLRRRIIGESARLSVAIENLPYKNYDYSKVMGACCENVVGYLPVPVGIAGPLKLDGELFYIPMATTEGCLVASTNRGCRALFKNGITSNIVHDGMTRAPVVRFPSVSQASQAKLWIETPVNFVQIKQKFDSTSRYARLTKIHIAIAGRLLFIRFEAETGDAMGMNMLSKGTEISLHVIQAEFPEMEVISLSGNYCTDKKPAAVNWIEGRGKWVVCEAIVPASVISTILKTSVGALVDVNISKNLIGSAMAGSIGGFNAHSANIVTAIYIATGQDPAQNVGSSNCITLMERTGENGQDLYMTCTMPSIEIGTVGGGTILPAQAACLEILNVKGPNIENPGENAKRLARIVCATVLAGELSLIAALAAGHLVKSHLKHNRSSTTMSPDITKETTERNLLLAPCKQYN